MTKPTLTLHARFVRLILGLLAGCLPMLGCSADVPRPHLCTSQLVFGLVVTVTESGSGRRVCDATVTARDGAYVETLKLFPQGVDVDAGTSCVYQGAGERAGNYTIEVIAGSRHATATAKVGRDECHVIPQEVTVTLAP